MIGRVYRGGRVGGLLRYLYGPGRHNEHVDPHLVGSWAGGEAALLLAMEPPEVDGGYDVQQLAGELEAPLRYAPKRPERPVWHCALRAAEADRRLTDAEWREVCEDVMHRTGIAPRGDSGGCQWVAVRHDDVSVHLVAVLARRDGADVRLWRDYHRLREACLAAEARLGLQATAPIDGTADPGVTRAESEKAARTGRREEPRARLRREVRLAAVHADSVEDFFTRVRGFGLLVRERYGEAGDLTGYAVAVPGDVTSDGSPVWYGGGRLAPDLTLPRIQSRWGAPAADASGFDRADGFSSGGEDFLRYAYSVEGRAGGRLTQAARAYGRAARWRPSRQRKSDLVAMPAPFRVSASARTTDASDILIAFGQLARALELQHLRQGNGHLASHARTAHQLVEAVPADLRPSVHSSGRAPAVVQRSGPIKHVRR